MAAPRMIDPKMEAISRSMQGQGGSMGAGQGNMPQRPAGGPQGAQAPADIALKMLDMITARLGEINPQAAQKLGEAVANLKSTIEEVKKEISASGGKPPVAGQPAGAPPAAVPDPRQPMPA